MKKITLCLVLLFAGFTFAQETTERKVQAGLTFGGGLNLNKSATKRMEVNGVGTNLAVGVALNYSLNPTIGIHSGLEINFERNKITPSASASPSYYYFDDTKILQSDQVTPGNSIFQYTNRTQKPIYLTIPTELHFRTKYFGYLRFYGNFGLRNSFLLGNKIDDEGFIFEGNTFSGNRLAAKNTTMRASRDMNFLRSNAGFTLGAEYNFSGSTTVFVELGYYYGFISIYADNKTKNQTSFYFDKANGSAPTYYSNNMTQSQLNLKIGVLF